MTELVEINSGPVIKTSALGFHNPTSATPSPHPESIPRTPKSPFSSAARMMTPLASPMKKAIISMQTYLEEVGHLTKLDPQDSWLPITESRNGNAYYAAFHTLSSGIGFQALLLPLAFTTLGCSMNRFLERATADTSGCQWLLLVIIIYIYLVFVCSAVILAQLPNLNSIAGISLVGAITAVTYCTLTWVLSVSKTKPPGVSYEPVWTESEVGNISSVLNALGIIAFAFRGHNLVLEIQGTMPSTAKNPSSVPMWKGVKFSYMIIACCLFPMAVGGYWAYGNLIPANGGMLSALDAYHRNDIPRMILGLTSLFVVINSLTSFQIYAMPVFDNLEFRYTSNKHEPCPWWLRTGIRVLFGCFAFFISVALPFLKNLAGLIGGIALPVTLAYPCLMWIMIKNPQRYSAMWWLNWLLGSLGMILSILLVCGAIWTIATQGITIHFFKPE